MLEPPPEAPGAATTLHVRRAVTGDRTSLGWLVERLSPLLLAQARYRLGATLLRRCDPEDLVHDAWVTMLPRLAELPPRGGRYTPVLLRFLSTTILNRCHELLRQHLRRGAQPLPTRDLTAEQSGVVSNALRVERDVAVREALASLEPADREVVLLRGVEQVPAKVAAAVVGVSEEAVSKRYRRALAKLRARLPGSVFDELAEPERD